MANPPPIKITALPSGKQPPAFVKFVNTWSKKYPGLKQWAPQILAYAKEVHIDPVYFASVILTESGANAKVPPSSAGALGIGQIMPLHIGESVPWDTTGRTKVTAADLNNPVFNLRFSAYHLKNDVGNYGYQGAYSRYNPGWTPSSGGIDPLTRIPHGYLPGVSSPGTSGAAGVGTPTGAAANPPKDPWVVITPKGVLKTVNSVTAPRNAVTDATGQAYTLSQFNSVGRGLDSLYLAWTGARANPKTVAQYIKSPVSDYEIQLRLSDPKQNPRLYKSPIWLTHAPDYESVYKGVYGNDAKPPLDLVRYAVVHNLSQAGFQQKLRDLPNYNTSEEYKGAAAQFNSGYQQIYGAPDAVGQQAIDKAVRQGWNADQWMQYLRAQPQYTSSGEFKANVYSLFGKLSLIPGAQTTGTSDQPAPTSAPASATAPPPPPVTSSSPIAPPTQHPTKPPAPFGPFPAVANG